MTKTERQQLIGWLNQGHEKLGDLESEDMPEAKRVLSKALTIGRLDGIKDTLALLGYRVTYWDEMAVDIEG